MSTMSVKDLMDFLLGGSLGSWASSFDAKNTVIGLFVALKGLQRMSLPTPLDLLLPLLPPFEPCELPVPTRPDGSLRKIAVPCQLEKTDGPGLQLIWRPYFLPGILCCYSGLHVKEHLTSSSFRFLDARCSILCGVKSSGALELGVQPTPSRLYDVVLGSSERSRAGRQLFQLPSVVPHHGRGTARCAQALFERQHLLALRLGKYVSPDAEDQGGLGAVGGEVQ